MIFFEQILHGYSDGHRMLESSIEISDLDKRIMLMMSDISGSGYGKGGEDYLTGYPLQKSQYYVLAKTWYANEMERPGCVWTHSLLIPKIVLNSLTYSNKILNLFRRPNSENWNKNYTERLVIDNFYNQSFQNTKKEIAVLKEITFALYQTNLKSIVSIIEDEVDLDDIILRIWLRQWPALRKEFTFCTGSLSNRKINKKSLDLQFCERKNISEFKRNDIKTEIIDLDYNGNKKKYPHWVEYAVDYKNNQLDDVANNIYSTLFDQLGSERLRFQSFVIIEEKFFNGIVTCDIDDILNVLLNLEESESNKKILTRYLFGINSILLKMKTDMKQLSEEQLLVKIISNPKFNKLSSESLQIKERTENLLKKTNSDVFEILGNRNDLDLSIHSYIFFKVISKHIKPDEFLTIVLSDVKIGAYIATQNPSLICNYKILNNNEINFDKLFEAVFLINNENVNSIFVTELVNQMLESKIEYATDIIYEAFKHETIDTILNWLNVSNENLLVTQSNWKRILQKDLDLCMNWLQDSVSLNKNVVLTIIEVHNVNSNRITPIYAKIFSKAICEIYNSLNREEYNLIAEFVFILALTFESRFSQELIDLSYDIVDKSIRENRISWHSWSKIESFLPEANWFEKWDRAKRLRKYLLQKKYKIKNSIEDFWD